MQKSYKFNSFNLDIFVDPKNRVSHSVTAKSHRFNLDSIKIQSRGFQGFISPFASGIHRLFTA